jgi:hypothetical protein
MARLGIYLFDERFGVVVGILAWVASGLGVSIHIYNVCIYKKYILIHYLESITQALQVFTLD